MCDSSDLYFASKQIPLSPCDVHQNKGPMGRGQRRSPKVRGDFHTTMEMENISGEPV